MKDVLFCATVADLVCADLPVGKVEQVPHRCVGNVRKRFFGQKGLVRGDDDVRHGDQPRQRVVLQNVSRVVLKKDVGFLFVNVKTSRADLAGLDACKQCLGIDQRAARGVDKDHALFHGCKALCVHHMARFGRERAVERNDVALAEQLVKRHVGERGVICGERVIAEDIHPEPAADVDEATTDLSGPHNANRLSVQVEADHVVQAEIEVPRADIGFVDAADRGQEQRHGVFRNRVGRVGGDAQDRQTTACVPQVHIVEARTAQKQDADAHIAEQVDDRGVNIVVDEYANGVAPAGKRCGILGQLVLKELETDIVCLAERLKGRAVIGLGIIECNFHA